MSSHFWCAKTQLRSLGSRPPEGESREQAHPAADEIPAALGDVDEAMVDAAGERERYPVGINSLHDRPDAERGSVRRDDLQPYNSPGLQLFRSHDLRPTVADVRDLTWIAGNLRAQITTPIGMAS